MPKKEPGKLHSPVPQSDFDRIDLQAMTCAVRPRRYYRLHGTDPSTGKPYECIYFSQKGSTRFDPPTGPGTMCVGETLPGILLEVFDDTWGAAGDPSRHLTAHQRANWYVSIVHLPSLRLFDATGINLSKIGTDLQLLTAEYRTTQEWALRIALHPANVDGIYYISRHNPQLKNVALFRRPWTSTRRMHGIKPRIKRSQRAIEYGRAVQLAKAKGLLEAATLLEVAILP
jgi:hypothetical protein